MIKSKRMRWAGNIACMGKRRGVYRVFVGRPVGKRPLGRPASEIGMRLITTSWNSA
jgi:hypothetical protein